MDLRKWAHTNFLNFFFFSEVDISLWFSCYLKNYNGLVFYDTLYLMPTVVACLHDDSHQYLFFLYPLPLKGEVCSPSCLNLGWFITTLTNTSRESGAMWLLSLGHTKLFYFHLRPLECSLWGGQLHVRNPAALRPLCCGEAQAILVKKFHAEMTNLHRSSQCSWAPVRTSSDNSTSARTDC